MSTVALAEELLLLAYDDESGKATVSHIGLDLGMAAAVLMDLALAGRITLDGNVVAVPNPQPVGDPISDEVLARIAADTPHTPASWVQRLRHGLRDRILAHLVERQIVRRIDETALDFIPIHRYPVTDPSVEVDIRERLGAALVGDAVPDERTAALATLVAAVRMEPTLGLFGDAAVQAHARLEEIAGGAGFTGTVSLEDSTVRPSVALVVACLLKAINAALGTPRT